MNFFHEIVYVLANAKKPMTVAEIEDFTAFHDWQIVEAIRTMAIVDIVAVNEQQGFYLK